MGIHYPLLADFQPRGAVADKFGVYLADKGITGRAIAIVDKAGNVAWLKNYDIPVVPDMNEVSQALAKSAVDGSSQAAIFLEVSASRDSVIYFFAALDTLSP